MDAERHVVQFSEVVRTILDGFEERNGYPPGENVVVEATGPEHLSALTEEFDGRVPGEVTTFFNRVAEVKLPNLWNGYFIGPTSWVAGIHKAAVDLCQGAEAQPCGAEQVGALSSAKAAIVEQQDRGQTHQGG